jgi:hypothetical protein
MVAQLRLQQPQRDIQHSLGIWTVPAWQQLLPKGEVQPEPELLQQLQMRWQLLQLKKKLRYEKRNWSCVDLRIHWTFHLDVRVHCAQSLRIRRPTYLWYKVLGRSSMIVMWN